MKAGIIRIMLLAGVFLAGCGTPKHLHRDREIIKASDTSEQVGLRAYRASSDTFDGKLNLLYEKKIKGSAGSPLLIREGLVAMRSTRQRFIGFDPMYGDRILQIKKRRGFILNPQIEDTLLILVERSRFGKVVVRNIFTGQTIAERTIKEIRSGPIIIGGRLIAGTDMGLLALSLPGLETEWQTAEKEMVSLPAAGDGALVFYAAANGLIRAVQADNGKEVWSTDCGAAISSELGPGRFLYVGLADSRVVAIDKESGAIVWERQLELPVHGGMAEYDGRIYFGGTDDFVHCLSADDGDPVWKYETGGIITASPVVYGRAVLVGSQDRYFYSLDRTSGQLVDQRRLEGAVTLTAAVDGGLILVADRANRLYCFKGY
jgi:outer membrane protein assembly factor BamB